MTTTRQTKTPQQRAQEAVDAKDRKIARFTDKAALLRADLAEVEHELDLTKRRREYLAASPDLEPADDAAQMSIEDVVADEPTLPDGGE